MNSWLHCCDGIDILVSFCVVNESALVIKNSALFNDALAPDVVRSSSNMILCSQVQHVFVALRINFKSLHLTNSEMKRCKNESKTITNDLVRDCGISSVSAMEIPQSCDKPSVCLLLMFCTWCITLDIYNSCNQYRTWKYQIYEGFSYLHVPVHAGSCCFQWSVKCTGL